MVGQQLNHHLIFYAYPEQSTRGSPTKKAATATKEATWISRGKERQRNALTTTNTCEDQFSVPPTRGIEIRGGDKSGGTTPQSGLVQTKRDLNGKVAAQISCKFFLFV